MPKLSSLLDNPDTVWEKITVPWYAAQTRPMEIISGAALWYHAGKVPLPIRWVLIRDPSGEYEPTALLSTDPNQAPSAIIATIVSRWRLEVTFEEAHRHLGMETQRQWSDKAIARITPVILGLFSWVTWVAHQLHTHHNPVSGRPAAWYPKRLPTFYDALVTVCRSLWEAYPTFWTSPEEPDLHEVPKALFHSLISTVCYAA